jgi:predicted kinase
MGVPFDVREQVAALVRYHQVPFHFLERPDPQRLVFQVSQTARCDHLAIVAEADARGRVCQDGHEVGRMLEHVALFVEYCREQRCLDQPRAFPSDHSRFLYFLGEGRDPDYPAPERCRCDVVLMSGLPGAGKDHWIRTNLPDLPVVALDPIREQLGVKPTDAQGPVLERARAQARARLRRGESFVWNATNLSRRVRQECIELFAGYGARIRIVYVEVPEARLYRQNRQRAAPVPERVLERLLDRWEVPDRTEAHQVDWIVAA